MADVNPPQIKLTLMEHSTFSGMLPISWCMNKEAKQIVAESSLPGGFPVHLLICAHPLQYTDDCSVYETRTVCKPSESIGYISFNRPGKHRLFVCLTNSYRLNARDGRSWDTTLLAFDANDESVARDESLVLKSFLHNIYASDSIDIDIPGECFASEPPQWEKNWVNFFFRYKAVDQCEYRKRRIIAYTIQPIILSVAFVAVFVWRLLSFLLLKAFLFKHVNFMPVFDNITSSSYHRFIEWDENLEITFKYSYIPYVPAPLNGVLMAVVYASIICTIFVNPLFFMMPFILMALVCVGIGLAYFLENQRHIMRYLSKFELLLGWLVPPQNLPDCEDKPIRTFKDLPRAKKTLKIRFMDLKSKVCRPFAR